jgi:nucleotide-binding universal stress UspA family protein
MKGSIHQIYVAIDGSVYAEPAIQWGVMLAKEADAELTLVHCVEQRFYNSSLFMDLSGILGAAPYRDNAEQLRSWLVSRGENVLESGRKIAAQLGVTAKTDLLIGACSEKICEAAKSANLVILGRRGENCDDGSHLVGSDAERIIRRLKCSCLVTPRFFDKPQTMVVGVNDSGPGRAAIQWAEYLHELFADCAVKPLHIREKDNDDDYSGSQVAGAELELADGNPEEALVAACQDEKQLAIIGVTGHSRSLRELLLGTLSFNVLHHVQGPALLAR